MWSRGTIIPLKSDLAPALYVGCNHLWGCIIMESICGIDSVAKLCIGVQPFSLDFMYLSKKKKKLILGLLTKGVSSAFLSNNWFPKQLTGIKIQCKWQLKLDATCFLGKDFSVELEPGRMDGCLAASCAPCASSTVIEPPWSLNSLQPFAVMAEGS